MPKLNEILEKHDFSLLIETTDTLGINITRAKIEAALVLNGHTLPLPAPVRFGLTNGSKFFLVFYLADEDLFLYERLTVAS